MWSHPALENSPGDAGEGFAVAAHAAARPVSDPLHAYELSKRGNALRVRAETVRWAKRDARINAISPGIIVTPMARDEITGPGGEEHRALITGAAARACRRAG
jgi:NAD(P)-dependent dehydrogenase (short-subunit alcohol dehydrogenase family)